MIKANAEKLKALYQNVSKHSGYQIFAARLEKILPTQDLSVQSRYERERLTYLAEHIDFAGKAIADIGGNTGFFTFEACELGAKNAVYIEGNAEHADFVRQAAIALEMDGTVEVVNEYYDFNKPSDDRFDILFLLNVLHHIGDDFGASELKQESALSLMVENLNALAPSVDIMVFQLGFNWKGNTSYPLFENGEKAEVIEFVKQHCSAHWDVKNIGIAERKNGRIRYSNMSADNIERDDSLGEFLNRPLFILRSKLSNAATAEE